MTSDKGIFIRNIYYMLSYAFQVLKQTTYEEIAAEDFTMVQDLFAAILAKGVARQLKQGVYKEYLTRRETLSAMRGKLDMPETIRNRMQRRQKLSCVFDELSENHLFHQILKTTMQGLVRDPGVKPKRKTALHQVLVHFDGVSLLPPAKIPWSRLHYGRNNRTYEMLLNICRFVLEGMLQTTDTGAYKMAAFSDEQMARLYERFVLEYYRKHHTYLSDARAAQVRWNLTGDHAPEMVRFLPAMQTDVTLRLGEKILIIDAKYYSRILQTQYEKDTLRSAHMYQIFSYVKNQDRTNSGNVAGLLLYAKTEEAVTPDFSFRIGGSQIGAKTLDLKQEFRVMARQLDAIALDYFGPHEIRCWDDGTVLIE